MISNNRGGLFAKRAGNGAGGRLASHVARWGWSVHGGDLWTRAGHGSTGSTVDRGRERAGARREGADRGGGAMAAALRLAVTALQCMGGRAEGTGTTRTSRRARYTSWLCERGAGEVGPHGGVVRRRRRSSGEGVCAKEREREGGKGMGVVVTSLRTPRAGRRRRRWSRGGFHRRRLELGRRLWRRRC